MNTNTVIVVIDVDESVAQGDEADLARERIIEAFQSTPPTGGWGLDGVSIQVGPATPAERAVTGDTGNRYVHPDPATQAQQVAAERFKQELESANTLGVQAEELVEYWREEHNQVAAERDALRSVIRKAISAHPLTGADPQGRGCWFRHFTAEDGHPSLAVISLSDAEHDAIRRALDASPTEGNPE